MTPPNFSPCPECNYLITERAGLLIDSGVLPDAADAIARSTTACPDHQCAGTPLGGDSRHEP